MLTGTGRPGARGLWGRRGRQHGVAGPNTGTRPVCASAGSVLISSPSRLRVAPRQKLFTWPGGYAGRWRCVCTHPTVPDKAVVDVPAHASLCVCRRIPGISAQVSRPEDPVCQLSPRVLPGQSRACTPPPTPHQRWEVSLSHFPKGRR